jgi:hypothetical protein
MLNGKCTMRNAGSARARWRLDEQPAREQESPIHPPFAFLRYQKTL